MRIDCMWQIGCLGLTRLAHRSSVRLRRRFTNHLSANSYGLPLNASLRRVLTMGDIGPWIV